MYIFSTHYFYGVINNNKYCLREVDIQSCVVAVVLFDKTTEKTILNNKQN